MPSFAAHMMSIYCRLRIRREHIRDADHLVRHLRAALRSPFPAAIPRGVRLERIAHGPLRGDCLTVSAPGRVVLYLHGGAYLAGETKTYHDLCARLALALNAKVYVLDYALGPESPFPAALHDAASAYRTLLRDGWSPEQISIIGDSAGGGLGLALLLALRDGCEPMPGCLVAYSPYSDLTGNARSYTRNEHTDPMFTASMLRRAAALYSANQDPAQPYLSPVLGDYRGLPPMLITVSEHECLRDDAYAVADKARAGGVTVELISRSNMVHVWPVFVPLLPEAREDMERVVSFVRQTCPTTVAHVPPTSQKASAYNPSTP